MNQHCMQNYNYLHYTFFSVKILCWNTGRTQVCRSWSTNLEVQGALFPLMPTFPSRRFVEQERQIYKLTETLHSKLMSDRILHTITLGPLCPLTNCFLTHWTSSPNKHAPSVYVPTHHFPECGLYPSTIQWDPMDQSALLCWDVVPRTS